MSLDQLDRAAFLCSTERLCPPIIRGVHGDTWIFTKYSGIKHVNAVA